MFKDLFRNRLFIGVCILVVCAVVSVYLFTRQTEKAPIKIDDPVEVEKPTAKAPPVGDTSQGGHWHGDEWHADPHETHDPPFQLPPTEPVTPRGTPFANFKPDPNDDPVEAAYKRLDYIANNLHEWGNFSPRTLELIDEMTPMPEPPKVEGQGDHTVDLLKELSALKQ